MIAILTKAIKDNWQPNEKEDILSTAENIELQNKKEKIKAGIISVTDIKYKTITNKLKDIFGDRVFKNNFSKREMAISFLQEEEIVLCFRWNFIFDNVNRDYIQTKDINKNIVNIIKELYPNIKDVLVILDSNIANYF